MSIFKTNQNKAERILRLLISLFLIPTPFFLGTASLYSILICIIGFILLFNSISGTCYTYMIFGINTCEIKKNDWNLNKILNSLFTEGSDLQELKYQLHSQLHFCLNQFYKV